MSEQEGEATGEKIGCESKIILGAPEFPMECTHNDEHSPDLSINSDCDLSGNVIKTGIVLI